MKAYDNLSSQEVLQELIKYKIKKFSWLDYGMYGEDVDVMTENCKYPD